MLTTLPVTAFCGTLGILVARLTRYRHCFSLITASNSMYSLYRLCFTPCGVVVTAGAAVPLPCGRHRYIAAQGNTAWRCRVHRLWVRLRLDSFMPWLDVPANFVCVVVTEPLLAPSAHCCQSRQRKMWTSTHTWRCTFGRLLLSKCGGISYVTSGNES